MRYRPPADAAPAAGDETVIRSMLRNGRVILGGVLVAASLVAMPTAGDAAWWPWSKKKETQQVEPPPVDPGTAQAAPLDAADRVARAEQKIRELTGQVEELSFRLRELQEQLQRIQADNDFRLNRLEGGSAAPAPVAKAASPDNSGVVVVAGAAAQPDSTGAVADGAAPAGDGQPLGSLVIDAPAGPAVDQPIDLTAGAPAAGGDLRGGTAVVASLGDPNADYERAYGSILSGDYELAEASFRGFLQTYPGDARSPDAQYWLGESLFARGQYREAADEFLAGYKAYPKSGKAPDTLLKLGLSLAGLGERDAACSTYAEVLKKYPQASKALRQRVATEQAVASC